MKKWLLIIFIIGFYYNSAFANSEMLSKQATAFYSDNNNTKTVDMILQINECDRSAQDWLLLGNVLADEGQIDNAVYMYRKSASADKKYYKAYYNLGNYYAEKGINNMAIENYKKAASLKKDNPYILSDVQASHIYEGILSDKFGIPFRNEYSRMIIKE